MGPACQIQHRESDGTQPDLEVSEEEPLPAGACCSLNRDADFSQRPKISVIDTAVISISMMETLRPELGATPIMAEVAIWLPLIALGKSLTTRALLSEELGVALQ